MTNDVRVLATLHPAPGGAQADSTFAASAPNCPGTGTICAQFFAHIRLLRRLACSHRARRL